MTEVTVPAAPPVVTIPGVELVQTGQWKVSTGTVTFTLDDLAAAVGAVDCAAVRRPVLKLGHGEPNPNAKGTRWDGEPAIGWIDNMALADGGNTIIGDYAGLPGWLGEILPSAYPDRSVEAVHGFICQLGHPHQMVITAVALLGVTRPGVGTLKSLQDVAGLYGVAAAAPGSGQPVTITIRAKESAMPDPVQVAASVTTEDVRRAYNEQQSSWSMWICEMQLDPLQLIVIDDASGDRYRVPVILGATEDDITFGDAVQVAIEYIDKPDKTAAAAERIVFASRAESRPDPAKPPAATPVAGPTTGEPVEPAAAAAPPAGPPAPIHQEGRKVDFTETQLTELRASLGFDGTEALDASALVAAVNRLSDTKIAAGGPGTVVIDAEEFAKLKAQIARGEEYRQSQLRNTRDQVLDEAIKAGKFAPSRLEQWKRVWDNDPEGTKVLIFGLTPGLVPVAEIGYPGDPDAYSDPEFDHIFPPDTRQGLRS